MDANVNPLIFRRTQLGPQVCQGGHWRAPTADERAVIYPWSLPVAPCYLENGRLLHDTPDGPAPFTADLLKAFFARHGLEEVVATLPREAAPHAS